MQFIPKHNWQERTKNVNRFCKCFTAVLCTKSKTAVVNAGVCFG